jgi:hypothetical protein
VTHSPLPETAAYRNGSAAFVQNYMDTVIVRLVKFIVKPLLIDKNLRAQADNVIVERTKKDPPERALLKCCF